ncbi:MAG: F0F1 ATP synthase subunit delta [Chromatiaceae bacterium]|nr:F0F1 ATP synthase subunit delta [Chromatiaceae bacterium]
MELSWSTFVLEIINFLVLVWILKRFLYRPVLEVIARRRAGIEKTLADAKALHADAEGLQQQYEGRLADWERERQQARATLARELDAERARRLAELQGALQTERDKAQAADAHRQADAQRKMEQTALAQGARFATRLLQLAAGADTEARLIDLAIGELQDLPDDRISALHNSYGKMPGAILVSSAFAIPDAQRARLEQALRQIIPSDIALQFRQDGALLAGVHIAVGTWALGLNLRDELAGFAELSHAE